MQVSKQIFDQMDHDGNGYIDRNEFSSIFARGGLKITAEVEGQEFSGYMVRETVVVGCVCSSPQLSLCERVSSVSTKEANKQFPLNGKDHDDVVGENEKQNQFFFLLDLVLS